MSYNLSASVSVGARSLNFVLEQLGLPKLVYRGEAMVADTATVCVWMRYWEENFMYQENEYQKVFTRFQILFLQAMQVVNEDMTRWAQSAGESCEYVDGVPVGYEARFF